MELTEKRCSKCGELKPISEFFKDNDRPCGYRAACKKCKSDQKKQYRELNRDKILEAERLYKINNREKVNEASKMLSRKKAQIKKAEKQKYYEEHKEEIEKAKELKKFVQHEKEKEKARKYAKLKYSENKDFECKKAKDKYYKNHEKNVKRVQKYKHANMINIQGKNYFLNTAPEELKPLLQIAIDSRNLIRETKNKLKGDVQHGQNINVESC